MPMWLPSVTLLKQPGAQSQSIFLAQLWHELLSTSSPDSFRAKALDLPLLLEELLRICQYAQQESKWISHVHLICEEIKSYRSFANDHAIPAVAESTLASIASFNASVQELPRLIEQVRIFLDLVPGYISALISSIQERAPDPGLKKQLSKDMAALATHVQARGAGDESILQINDELCGLAPREMVDRLCADVNRQPQEYFCFVAISAPRSMASRLFADVNLREVGATRFPEDGAAKSWYLDRSEGIVVEWRGMALSRRKAAELALAEVFSLIHLHALYANNVMVTASPSVMVEGNSTFHVVEVTPSRHFGLEPRNGSEALSRLRYMELGGRLQGRIANLLESHALAVSANDARTAVFHLWTALETLASGLGVGSIGERVADVVAPIVAWRRVDKIATYLGISGHELRAHMGSSFDLTHFPNSSGRHIDRIDILKAITGVDRNPIIMDGFKAFGPSPLLAHRLYRAWEECNNPAELRKTLLMSKNRIKWQVMRFYRARNLLVHYGEVDHLATRLLENAQYYLSICVGRVLYDLTSYKEWSVNTSLEFHRHRFDSLIDRLQAKPEAVRVDELILHVRASNATTPVWPKNSAAESSTNTAVPSSS